jgi:hypothetical protein
MKCITITPVEIAGKASPAGVELDLDELTYEKLLSRGAVKPVEIDFKPAPVQTEALVLPTKVEPQKRFTLGLKKRKG